MVGTFSLYYEMTDGKIPTLGLHNDSLVLLFWADVLWRNLGTKMISFGAEGGSKGTSASMWMISDGAMLDTKIMTVMIGFILVFLYFNPVIRFFDFG